MVNILPFNDELFAVLLSAFTGVENNGYSLLIGETREEYVGRRKSALRMEGKSAETISKTVRATGSIAGDLILLWVRKFPTYADLIISWEQFPDKDSLQWPMI